MRLSGVKPKLRYIIKGKKLRIDINQWSNVSSLTWNTADKGGGLRFYDFFSVLHTLRVYCTPSEPTAHPPSLLHTLRTYCTPSDSPYAQLYCTPSRMLHNSELCCTFPNLTAHPPKASTLLHTLRLFLCA